MAASSTAGASNTTRTPAIAPQHWRGPEADLQDERQSSSQPHADTPSCAARADADKRPWSRSSQVLQSRPQKLDLYLHVRIVWATSWFARGHTGCGEFYPKGWTSWVDYGRGRGLHFDDTPIAFPCSRPMPRQHRDITQNARRGGLFVTPLCFFQCQFVTVFTVYRRPSSPAPRA